MKPALVLVAATLSFAATACTTTANRRDLFAPTQPRGPYTIKYRNATLIGRQDHRSHTHRYVVTRRVGDTAPASSAAAAPGAATTGAPQSPPPPPPPPPPPGVEISGAGTGATTP